MECLRLLSLIIVILNPQCGPQLTRKSNFKTAKFTGMFLSASLSGPFSEIKLKLEQGAFTSFLFVSETQDQDSHFQLHGWLQRAFR